MKKIHDLCRLSLALAVGATFNLASLQAAVIYDESIDGDLSGVLSTPTPFAVSNGESTIVATIGDNGNTGATNGSDADYLVLNIPVDVTITSFVVDSYLASPVSSGGGSFVGYRAGTGFPGTGFGDVDSFVIFNGSTGDLLSALGLGSLGAGSHSFWFQETTATVVSYSVTYEAIPEPSAAFLAGIGLLGFSLWRRKKTPALALVRLKG